VRLAVKPGHDKQLIGDEYLLTVLKGQAGIGCHGNNDPHPLPGASPVAFHANRLRKSPAAAVPPPARSVQRSAHAAASPPQRRANPTPQQPSQRCPVPAAPSVTWADE